MKKTIYKVPVIWQEMGYIDVPASDQKEAISLAEKAAKVCRLPDNGEYLEDSFCIDSDIVVDAFLETEKETVLAGTPMVFESGADFYDWFLENCNTEEAIARAKQYLDAPLDQSREDYAEETSFREELREAVEKTEASSERPSVEEYMAFQRILDNILEKIPSEEYCTEEENSVASDMANLKDSLKYLLQDSNPDEFRSKSNLKRNVPEALKILETLKDTLTAKDYELLQDAVVNTASPVKLRVFLRDGVVDSVQSKGDVRPGTMLEIYNFDSDSGDQDAYDRTLWDAKYSEMHSSYRIEDFEDEEAPE